MFAFLALQVNLPFTISLMVMFLITLIELFGFFTGSSLSHILDHHFVFDHEIPDPTLSGFKSIFSWLGIGRVPIVVLLIIFLLLFGMFGLFVEGIGWSLLGMPIPMIFAIIISLSFTLPLQKYLCIGISKIIPQDETEVISEETFIGKIATIVIGTAKQGKPAQAKLRIEHQTHYLMVEPDHNDESFGQGESVIIVKKSGSKFVAIKNTILN